MAHELAGMIVSAIAHDGPMAIRFPKTAAGALPVIPAEPVPVGVWEELREGEEVLLLATGRMVEIAQKVAANGAGSGFSIGVVNARWIKPLDPRLDQWAARYRYVVTLEDNVVSGGFGSAVLEELARHGLAGRVSVWGLPDRFLPAGSVEELLHEVGLDEDAILDATRSAGRRNRSGVDGSWPRFGGMPGRCGRDQLDEPGLTPRSRPGRGRSRESDRGSTRPRPTA